MIFVTNERSAELEGGTESQYFVLLRSGHFLQNNRKYLAYSKKICPLSYFQLSTDFCKQENERNAHPLPHQVIQIKFRNFEFQQQSESENYVLIVV